VAEPDRLPEVGHEERRAKSFKGGPAVTAPTELRPGDAWVVRDGKHIRIVIAVREAANAKGEDCIEFDTAESAGDSTKSIPGPVTQTWRTHSRERINPVTDDKGKRQPGSFHRIQE
jgi:hypothetical protein